MVSPKIKKTMLSQQHYPEEIMMEILSRLPSKSLLRFKSVCKSWYSLINDPLFISLHHHRSFSYVVLQFFKELIGPKASPLPIQCSIRHNDPLLTATYNSSLPLPFSSQSIIVAIYHGLICLSLDEEFSSLIICNPSLRRFLSLPKPIPNLHDDPLIPNSTAVYVGLGFDSRNRHYKVIRIVTTCPVNGRHRVPFFEAHVYNLASGFWGFWRRLRSKVAPFCITDWTTTNNKHGFVNGLIHWGATRKVGEGNHASWYLFVLSFDFQDEVFHEIMLPKCLAHSSSTAPMITVVGGNNNVNMDLTVYYVNHESQSGSIWVMKEYGVVESWNKLFAYDIIESSLRVPSLGITISNMIAPIPPSAPCITNNGEILLMQYNQQARRERLYLLDVEKKKLIDLQIGGEDYTWAKYFYVGYYAESLVLPNNNVFNRDLKPY